MLADNFTFLTAQSADETKSTVESILGWDRINFVVEFGTGVSAGEVVLESAWTNDYAGTWNVLSTITYSSGAPLVVMEAVDVCGKFVRARINTAISGGTVNVYMTRMKVGNI